MAEEIGFRAEKSKILINKEELSSTVHQASKEFDVIIINAGSSAGSEDFTEGVISELGKLIFSWCVHDARQTGPCLV